MHWLIRTSCKDHYDFVEQQWHKMLLNEFQQVESSRHKVQMQGTESKLFWTMDFGSTEDP